VGLLTWQIAEKLVAGKGKGKRQKAEGRRENVSLVPFPFCLTPASFSSTS
jgi:hypothetical protein